MYASKLYVCLVFLEMKRERQIWKYLEVIKDHSTGKLTSVFDTLGLNLTY